MSDGSGTTNWTYDQLGRITSKTQTVGSVVLTMQYSYDAQGHLESMTYPDGSVMTYRYDTLGRIAGADVALPASSSQSLIDNITYLPFGPISRFDYAGNYPDQDRNYDLDYRPTGLTEPLARSCTTKYVRVRYRLNC